MGTLAGIQAAASGSAFFCAHPGKIEYRVQCPYQGLLGFLKNRRPARSRSAKGVSVNPKCFSQAASTDSSPEEDVYRVLYPRTPSHSSGYLKVSDLHTIYFEIFGNPKGRPAVFLHGGPGAGCTKTHACFFDPEHYMVVLFDQRGCGKSTPAGCLEQNTTWDLVEDIEKLRKHVGVDRWLVLGGSWGVTLGLAYAQTHPGAVSGIIVRGVCLLRQQEIDWFYKQGANFLFPFGWEQLISFLEPVERENVLAAFYRRLTSSDSSIQESAAQQWLRWEFGLSSLSASESVTTWDGTQYSFAALPKGEPLQMARRKSNSANSNSSVPSSSALPSGTATDPLKVTSATSATASTSSYVSSRVVQARLECHYFVNRGFLEDNQLLLNIQKIRHIPAVIVQGRYDFVCPLVNAFDLHRAWPEAKLRIVTNAGHSMYEKGITHELVRSTDEFKQVEY